MCLNKIKKVNFKVSEYGNLLLYRKEYTTNTIKEIIRKNNLNGLRILALLSEDRLKNLDFLEEFVFLESLEISSVDDYDFRFLNKLTNLKRLSIEIEGKNEIDLSKLTELTSLFIHWRKGNAKINNCCNLERLVIYDFTEEDFNCFCKFNSVKELIIKTSTIKSLSGIENFNSIESILLGNCRKLETIKEINGIKTVKKIVLNLCPKLNDLSYLNDLPSLDFLHLIDCQEVKTVSFLHKLKSLSTFYLSGNTVVSDGDLRPVRNIANVNYSSRKHYRL